MSIATTTGIELTSAKDLGKAIRNARTKMGLQQAKAALLCGVGIRYLSDLENGKETVRLEQALKVIAGLGLVLTIGSKKPFWSKDGRPA
jgi:HTH-type transcriptional regulator / antitoxin HipB